MLISFISIDKLYKFIGIKGIIQFAITVVYLYIKSKGSIFLNGILIFFEQISHLLYLIHYNIAIEIEYNLTKYMNKHHN